MTFQSLIKKMKIVFILIVMVMVQLACQASPTDSRVGPALYNVVIPLSNLFNQLKVLPDNFKIPPLITQIDISSDKQTVTLTGSGTTENEPTTIRIYRILLQGCGQPFAKGDLLVETQINDDRTWSVQVNAQPGEIFGATQVINKKESGLSNLKINTDPAQILQIDNLDQLQSTQEVTQNGEQFTASGKSIPGACISIQNKDKSIGIVGSASADSQGNWQLKFPVNIGENDFQIFVLGWEELGKEIIIPTYIVKMEWPYSPEVPTRINAWVGRNDYHWTELNTFHDGLDIGAQVNTEVRAVADGKVVYIQNDPSKSGGNMVFIDHGGWFSGYLHLNSINIVGLTPSLSNTVYVKAGDVIGMTGKTGCKGCGYHLHFSAYEWGKGNWANSTGSRYIYPVRFGNLININPPAGIQLNNGQDSSVQLKKCVSYVNYWNMDWSQIPISNFSYPSGTEFTKQGGNDLCAIKP